MLVRMIIRDSVYITIGCYDLIVEVWLPVKHGLIDFISGLMSASVGIVAASHEIHQINTPKRIEVP